MHGLILLVSLPLAHIKLIAFICNKVIWLILFSGSNSNSSNSNWSNGLNKTNADTPTEPAYNALGNHNLMIYLYYF